MPFFSADPPNAAPRIIAPGIALSAGGTIPEHDGTPEAEAAEGAAQAVLAAEPKAAHAAPSPDVVKKAQEAALEVWAAKKAAAPELPRKTGPNR